MNKRVAVLFMLAAGAAVTSRAVGGEERIYHGAEAVDAEVRDHVVHVDLGDTLVPGMVRWFVVNAPNLRTLVISGPRFHDANLEWLDDSESLRTLVLDCTDVSDAKIAELQIVKPDLTVVRSQRWAIQQIRALSRTHEVDTRSTDSFPELRGLLGGQLFEEAVAVRFWSIDVLDNLPMTEVLNEELAPLRFLRTITWLDLTNTRINDGGMFYLKPLTRLERLRIPPDEVSAEGLIHLREMKHLKEFDGQIDDAGIRQLTSLQALESLSIAETSEMTDAGLEPIGQLKRLQTLVLRAPQIEGTGLRHLTKLAELQNLTLGTGVRDISALPEFPSLHWLSLTGTAVSDEAIAPLRRCCQLENLAINNTAIGDEGVMHLSGLSQIRGLDLSDTQVGDAGLAALQKLPNLRVLGLNRTRVSNAGLAILHKFPSLELLALYGMPLDEEGITNLMKLQQLKSLKVSYPQGFFPDPLSQNAANRELSRRLSEALPQCRIY